MSTITIKAADIKAGDVITKQTGALSWLRTGAVHSTYPATVGVRELGPRVCINYGPGTLSPDELFPHALVTVERE